MSSKRQTCVTVHAKTKRPPPLRIGYNQHGAPDKRAVLYRNFHEIDRHIFLVEISRTDRKVFAILFPNFEEPTVHLSQSLPVKVAYKLMADNQNSFEKFIQQFTVKFGHFRIGGYDAKRVEYAQSALTKASPRTGSILRSDETSSARQQTQMLTLDQNTNLQKLYEESQKLTSDKNLAPLAHIDEFMPREKLISSTATQ